MKSALNSSYVVHSVGPNVKNLFKEASKLYIPAIVPLYYRKDFVYLCKEANPTLLSSLRAQSTEASLQGEHLKFCPNL